MKNLQHNQIDMVTANNHIVNFAKPKLTHVDMNDIRIHTTNICRYNGALNWKLVQHLALCSLLATADNEKHIKQQRLPTQIDERFLLGAYCAAHDFHEIYCTDVVSGLKKYLPEYQRIEEVWEEYVHEQIGLDYKYKNKELVRHIDLRALVIEMTMLRHPAAALVAKRYGGPITPEERDYFIRIHSLTLEECWKIVWDTVERGRNILIHKEGYDIEMF